MIDLNLSNLDNLLNDAIGGHFYSNEECCQKKKIRKIREKFMQMENMQMTLMDRWRATNRDNGT